ncbi:hypothetical protein KUL49_36920 [Alteromonas sp. KUL49]|nr:hypothetical protein KUL49_36920 [Alteromonas sp. KUL49]
MSIEKLSIRIGCLNIVNEASDIRMVEDERIVRCNTPEERMSGLSRQMTQEYFDALYDLRSFFITINR